MKEAVNHRAATATRPQPFFKKEGSRLFGKENAPATDAFFRHTGAQPTLDVGRRDDVFEKQADATADRVVRNLQQSPLNAPVGAAGLQAKPADKSREEQKEKEGLDELDATGQKLQRRPAFESNEDPAERQKIQQKSNETNKPVQLKAGGAAATKAPAGVEASLQQSKGAGAPLAQDTRGDMEAAFGADFSGVRIHTGTEAAGMSNELGAQAFTHGSDIYFNEGKFNPASSNGKHLLAHELTHTIQQGGGVNKKVQRKKGASKPSAKEPVLDKTTNTIIFPHIQLPAFKELNKNIVEENGLKRPKSYKRNQAYEIGPDDDTEDRKKPQTVLWMNNVQSSVKKLIEGRTKQDDVTAKAINGKTVYYFMQTSANKKQYLIGTVEELIEASVIPKWSKDGKATAFDVDHVKELQLGGGNELKNIELLQFSANRSSGPAIAAQIETKVAEVSNKKISDETGEEVEIKGDVETVKAKYDLHFTKVKYNLNKFKKDDNLRWTEKEITSGKHLKGLKPVKNLDELSGKIKNELIYTSEIGGRAVKFSVLNGLTKKGDSIQLLNNTFKPVADQNNATGGDVIGSFDADFGSYGSKLQPKKINLPVYKIDGIIHGGGVKRGGVKGKGGLEQLLVGFKLQGLSPIKIDTADIDEQTGLYAYGRVIPTLPLIKGVEMDFYIDKDEIRLFKTFSTGELSDKFPKPFVLNHAALTVSMGSRGVKVQGDVLFEITGVGAGRISGNAKDDGEFGITGSFNFDEKLFKGKVKKAGIDVAYNRKNGWRIEGNLEIQKEAVKGIKQGSIHLLYENEILKAEGVAETTIKGVKDVKLKMVFGKNIFLIEGDVRIEKLPGIKEGQGRLQIVKQNDVYDFSGKGKIIPDIPGIDSGVDFSFAKEVFTVNAFIQYKRDRLEGGLLLGVTNEEVVDGKPTGKVSETYTVYGGGQLKLKIETIVVTAGVKLLPNGEVEVMGKIELPRRFNLFPPPLPKRKKRLVNIPITIPTPIPIIKIFVKGYVDAEAEIAAGYLDDVFAEVHYNPARPEEMKITGGMSFNLPAYAQVKAGVEFGVRASIAIASISGGIDLSAALRLQVPQPLLKGTLSWTPANGFELEGMAKIGIKPSLTFTGAFKITGEIDLLFGSIEKSWQWPFASLSLSPDVPFGLEFPFKYNKNTPFTLSIDQLKFTYPTVSQLAGALGDAVVKEVDNELG